MRADGVIRLALVIVLACVGAYAACRAEDPKTPPNQPFPSIDKPSDPRPPLLGDSGSESTSTN